MVKVKDVAVARDEEPARILRARAVVKRYGTAAALVGLILLPVVVHSQFRLRILVFVFIDAALAVGLVVSLGYTGQFNLSQGTFFGIGAYVTANLLTGGWPFLVAFIASGIAAAVGGALFGLVSLRIRGDYFALLSLAFTVAATQGMENWDSLTRGREGFAGIPEARIFGWTVDTVFRTYYVALVLLLVAWLLVLGFAKSFAGRAMLAVRYDEVAAQAMGINVPFTKVLALTISSFVAGLAGSVLAIAVLFIAPSNFSLLPSIESTVYVIIGGMASVLGAALATGLVTFVTEEFRTIGKYRTGLIGAVVLVAVLARGGVLGDATRALRERLSGLLSRQGRRAEKC